MSYTLISFLEDHCETKAGWVSQRRRAFLRRAGAAVVAVAVTGVVAVDMVVPVGCCGAGLEK